jgi:hypothetical protein
MHTLGLRTWTGRVIGLVFVTRKLRLEAKDLDLKHDNSDLTSKFEAGQKKSALHTLKVKQ